VEPYSALLYTRKTLAGEFIVVNKKLVEMLERGLWNERSQEGDYQRGSIKGIDLISRNSEALPDSLGPEAENSPTARKDKSSLCMSVPEHEHLHGGSYAGKVKAMLMWGNAGLKTGIYYLRSQSQAKAQQFVRRI
jgi:hypothetical protein